MDFIPLRPLVGLLDPGLDGELDSHPDQGREPRPVLGGLTAIILHEAVTYASEKGLSTPSGATRGGGLPSIHARTAVGVDRMRLPARNHAGP